jgi:hypothetical protein
VSVNNPDRSPVGIKSLKRSLNAFAFLSGRQDRELLGAISRGLLDCPRRV